MALHAGFNEIPPFRQAAQAKTKLKTSGQRAFRRRDAESVFVVLAGRGKGKGPRTRDCVLLGSMTTSREGREHSQPSGLNYLLTQIIKFQGPHCSGATKTRGRPGPSAARAGGSPRLTRSGYSSVIYKILMLSKEASIAHSIVGSF